MTRDELASALDVSRETLDKLQLFQSLVEQWQPRINLVGKATLLEIWRRHFLDSAQLFEFLAPDDATVVDLGSGAGLPGLVLALLVEERGWPTRFHLVEADTRKAAFLVEARRALALGERVSVHAVRAESLAVGPLAGTASVVTARALAPLATLCALAAPLLRADGRCVLPKGARHDSEIAAAREAGWRFALETRASRTEDGAAILVLRDLARDSRGGI